MDSEVTAGIVFPKNVHLLRSAMKYFRPGARGISLVGLRNDYIKPLKECASGGNGLLCLSRKRKVVLLTRRQWTNNVEAARVPIRDVR